MQRRAKFKKSREIKKNRLLNFTLVALTTLTPFNNDMNGTSSLLFADFFLAVLGYSSIGRNLCRLSLGAPFTLSRKKPYFTQDTHNNVGYYFLLYQIFLL